MFSYKQSSGEMTKTFSLGYSGEGEGKNNPALQNHPSLGPIPVGEFDLEVIVDDKHNWVDYEGKKAPVIRITPKPGTEMFGRAGFLIHGDSISKPGTASLGCIIMNHEDRVAIAYAITAAGDKTLKVF